LERVVAMEAAVVRTNAMTVSPVKVRAEPAESARGCWGAPATTALMADWVFMSGYRAPAELPSVLFMTGSMFPLTEVTGLTGPTEVEVAAAVVAVPFSLREAVAVAAAPAPMVVVAVMAVEVAEPQLAS
jgi:hypothetical protein